MYVIIGGGVAAVGAIEGIRSRDRRTPITLISKENYLVYGRPLIVEYLLGSAPRSNCSTAREPTTTTCASR